MQAEIIAIGSELTSGAKLDTNSRWLSLRLAEFGISVARHTTMADDLGMIVRCLHRAADDCDLVLITGGLGPTFDDLTRQALADWTGTPLVLNETSLAEIRELFASRGREMPERNVVQAMFPRDSEPLPNHHGTAPGVWVEVPRTNGAGVCRAAAMPGVPYEMHAMFDEQVVPRLPVGNRVMRRAVVNCFGVGESQAELMLGDLTARGNDPEVGITVHEATIALRIAASGSSAEECERKIQTAKAQIHERLGDLVFGEESDELEHAVARQLTARSETLATVEIGTAGLLSERLCHLDNDQRPIFAGGLVFPDEPAALNWLPDGAESPTDKKRLAVSLAAEVLERSQATYGLAVLDWDAESVARGDVSQTTAVALVGPDVRVAGTESPFGNERLQRSRIAKAALNLLRKHLLRSKRSG